MNKNCCVLGKFPSIEKYFIEVKDENNNKYVFETTDKNLFKILNSLPAESNVFFKKYNENS